MIQNILLVGCGRFVGGTLRYLIGQALAERSLAGMATGTVCVNLAGCLMFGVIYGLLERFGTLQSGWAALLTVGLCGGFTTFSTFGNEMLTLMRAGNMTAFCIYTLVSVAGGLLLLFIGRQLALASL